MRREGHFHPGLSQVKCHWQPNEYSVPRKISKDTSRVGVSPHTHTHTYIVRPPLAKHQTIGVAGRRLCFPVQDKSNIVRRVSSCRLLKLKSKMIPSISAISCYYVCHTVINQSMIRKATLIEL